LPKTVKSPVNKKMVNWKYGSRVGGVVQWKSIKEGRKEGVREGRREGAGDNTKRDRQNDRTGSGESGRTDFFIQAFPFCIYCYLVHTTHNF
jgi:hypothetical protein